MAMMDQQQADQLRKIFTGLKHEVKIIYFTQQENCPHCRIGEEVIGLLPPLSDKIKVEVHDVGKEPDAAKPYGVYMFPAIVIEGDRDYGIRFFGIPGGHEFTAFIQSIIYVSLRDPQLAPKVLAELKKIDQPVHLQVMTSLDCPYCPFMVKSAHRLAMANPNIRADMIDTAEFPVLAATYNVTGVPDTVINDHHRVVGALPELELVYFIQEALGLPLTDEGRAAVDLVRLQIAGAQHQREHTHEHEHGHAYRYEHAPAPPRPAAAAAPKDAPPAAKKAARKKQG